jgi:hypothetical protein
LLNCALDVDCRSREIMSSLQTRAFSRTNCSIVSKLSSFWRVAASEESNAIPSILPGARLPADARLFGSCCQSGHAARLIRIRHYILPNSRLSAARMLGSGSDPA